MKFTRSWVDIDLDNFAHNLEQLKSRLSANTEIMQIVKADAYGHGAYQIALQSLKQGVSLLGVANTEEGLLLRYQGIIAPIVILSPSFIAEIPLIIEQGLTPTVSAMEFANSLNSASTSAKTKVHIEIDTGMGRSGFRYDEAVKQIEEINELPNLVVEGIFSHFSSSESDQEFTLLQSERFRSVIDNLGFRPDYCHIANSPATLTCLPSYANLVRLGLLSYGVYPDESFLSQIDLKPVMSFKSFICQIKRAYQGESIGYNRTYKAERDITYAIVPVGYADGYDYLFSNKGLVSINNRLFNVIGKVSMDMITIDITDADDIMLGDEVVIIGEGELRSELLVQRYKGLSYELLAQIGRRARRYYHANGKVVAEAPISRREFVSTDFSDEKLNTVIESAISQRLQSQEIASLLYSGILRKFFIDKDRDIHYRKEFRHEIIFTPPTDSRFNDYYRVETRLTFKKLLQNDYFFVVCTKKIEQLEKYFRRRDVEYRWLLDDNFLLNDDFFQVTEVSINSIPLSFTQSVNEEAMLIKCAHSKLKNLLGKEVNFSISTATYYPKKSHQFTVYVTEITKGVRVDFICPTLLNNDIETVTLFSGQGKYPQISKEIIEHDNQGLHSSHKIIVKTEPDEWVFPNSGIIFAYGGI